MSESTLLYCDTGWIKVFWLRVIFLQIIIKWLVCAGLSCYVSLMRIYSLLATRGCYSFCHVVSYAKQVKLFCLGLSLLKLRLPFSPTIHPRDWERQREKSADTGSVRGGQELCSCGDFAGLFLVVPFVNFYKLTVPTEIPLT